MSLSARIPRALYLRATADLARRHPFAFERVGFFSGRLGNRWASESQILFSNYYPVLDDHYIDDPSSGARINSDAIREAMQRALDTGEGLFHVHCHFHDGKPRFSSMDLEEIPLLISSLQIAGPQQPHGMVLMSHDQCVVHVRMPSMTTEIVADKVSVVGYPLEIFV
jgi:hypothetical protein